MGWNSHNACQNRKHGSPRLNCFLRSNLIRICAVSLGLFGMHLVFEILVHLPYVLVLTLEMRVSVSLPGFKPAVSLRPPLIIFLTFSGIEFFASSISCLKLTPVYQYSQCFDYLLKR